MALNLKKDVPKDHPSYSEYVNAVKHSDSKTAKELLKDMRKTKQVFSSHSRREITKRELKAQCREMDDEVFEDSDDESFYYDGSEYKPLNAKFVHLYTDSVEYTEFDPHFGEELIIDTVVSVFMYRDGSVVSFDRSELTSA